MSPDPSRHYALLTPAEAITAIDTFAWVSHAREQPAYMDFLINAWRGFRKDAATYPLLKD